MFFAFKVMLMKRGQAFETMMLVISVIVALAILAVLMGILGGLGTGITNDPKTVMHNTLRDIQTKGFGISTPVDLSFQKGQNIYKREIIGNDIPLSTSGTALNFVCGANAVDICATGGACAASGSKPIQIENNNVVHICSGVKAKMVVCGNDEKPKSYCIVLAKTGDDAVAKCRSECQFDSA